jgi:hypothetical protein
MDAVKTETVKAFTVKDWQKRVLIERSELEDRLGKLKEFLASFASAEGHDSSVQGLSYLDLQKSAMELYLYTLNRRIELFE